MNLLQKFEKEQIDKLSAARGEENAIPDFQAGDTLRVNVRIVEGTVERIQAFEGICIARKNAGISSSFIVRKLSHGEGVERIFPLYSPRLESIHVVRRGDVRRAKLYYLRGLTGKAARIKEKVDYAHIAAKEAKKAEKAAASAKKAAKAAAPKDDSAA